MAVYEFTAKNENGDEFTGTCGDVDSVAMLAERLAKMGDTLLKARRSKGKTEKRPKIKLNEIVNFIYKFATMYSSGLPIIQSLEAIGQETENDALRYILLDIQQSIETGATLKDAFKKHEKTFSNFFIGMLEVGESGGKLTETLEMSASYVEKQADIKSKVKAAFAYPIIVGILCVIIVCAVIIFVIPVFSELYEQLDAALPGPTQFLIIMNTMLIQWWWLAFLAIGGGIFILRRLLEKPRYRLKWDAFKLNMPIFAKLNRMVVISRFMRSFAILVTAGLSFDDALKVANDVTDNAKISEITDQLQKSIAKGNSMADSLRECDIFPPTIIQLVAAGEEVGALAKMLNKGIDFLDKEIERKTKSLLVKLEPIMTLTMAVIVGFILIGVYLPMFDYIAQLSSK
ncbi:MAG: type II secretion system F family protein [Planctomycetota bacterium]|jgi:type IV pilus assembly protein PilC